MNVIAKIIDRKHKLIKQLSTIKVLDMTLISTIQYQY